MTRHRGPTLIDGHVHFYEMFNRERFLDGALQSFQAAAASLGIRPAIPGCLMMSERPHHHAFREFRDEADKGGNGREARAAAQDQKTWQFFRTREQDSLVARRDTGEVLILIAGQQIETSEKLEILALCCDKDFPKGQSFSQSLDAVLAGTAITVLPWGFGKWWSKRGEVIAKAVRQKGPNRLFVGDNSGRPMLLPAPRIFRDAADHGVLNLPGTDPLPLASEEGRSGGFGFVLDCDLDKDYPAETIRKHLRGLERQPRTYGHLENLGRFIANQVKLRR